MAVQALENTEYLLGVFRLNSNTVVFHAEQPCSVVLAFGSYTNHRRFHPTIFDGVSNQILK